MPDKRNAPTIIETAHGQQDQRHRPSPTVLGSAAADDDTESSTAPLWRVLVPRQYGDQITYTEHRIAADNEQHAVELLAELLGVEPDALAEHEVDRV